MDLINMKNDNIEKIILEELISSEDQVIKLRKLNKNPILNNYLMTKQHKELVKTIIPMIEKGTQTTTNIDVLKHYLHELVLIFNLNISQNYLPGVA